MDSSLNQVFIIGAGAIGKALAVCLKLAGRDVELIRGTVIEGARRTERIRVEFADGIIKEADIAITTLAEYSSLNGIVVLASKSYGNEQLSAVLKDKISHSPIVLLQNGLGIEQPFLDNNFLQVYRCVLFVTSQSINETTVRFKPVASCPIGLIKGAPHLLNHIVDILNTPMFGFKVEPGIEATVWKKAIINCVFNSICPLLDVDNGIFHRDKAALQIGRKVIEECIGIAKDKGILLNAIEVEGALLQISKSSDGQLISTLQDIQNHRRTEIETLNFAVLKIAKSLNKEHTVETTKLLGELTRIKAEFNLQKAL
jgi:2-dehydropantoate 2-reductase